MLPCSRGDRTLSTVDDFDAWLVLAFCQVPGTRLFPAEPKPCLPACLLACLPPILGFMLPAIGAVLVSDSRTRQARLNASRTS